LAEEAELESCDVLIVGGGPAGSTCAWRLAAAGLDVLVLDKKEFPRDKVCAGWITPQVVEALALDTAHYRQGRVLQAIHSLRTGVLGGPEITTRYGHTVSYGIRRCEFDDYLLRRSGARLRFGEALTGLERDGEHWIANGAIRAPLVVGAGGHSCPVARRLGARLGSTVDVVAAQEVEFEMGPDQARACRVAADTPELFFCPELDGYGWCFRKGDFLNIGLGRQDKHRLAERVAQFCEFLKAQGKVGGDIPDAFHGHAYLLYQQRQPRPLLGDGALLVGDAAGLAYGQSGEGIRPAVESGLLAAEVILAARGDYRAGRLAAYEARVVGRFGKRQADDGWLPSGFKRAVAARLLANPWFTRHVVLDRWFLHRRQPPLGAA